MKTVPSENRHGNQSGLTLLEMVIVMSILAAVTTLAIRLTSGTVNEARFEATRQTLDGFRTACIGVPSSVNSGAAPQLSSFVADLGRLPRTIQVSEGGINYLTLDELILRPASLPPYQLLRASHVNTELVPDPESLPLIGAVGGNLLAANPVDVPLGWRGPYVYLASGQSTLVDGWGKAIRPEVGNATGLIQFEQYGAVDWNTLIPATAARAEVARIKVAGGPGTGVSTASDDPYLATQSITVNRGEIQSWVILQLTINASAANSHPTNATGLFVAARVFGPNPEMIDIPAQASFPIRCAYRRVEYSTLTYSLPIRIPSSQVPFLIGPKAVTVELVDSSGALAGTSGTILFRQLTRPVITFLQPGINFVQATLDLAP